MKKINEVFETNDYNIFRFISNNRIVSKAHVNKIMESMSKKRLISPILINEKGEIIDGQHRFLAQKKLNLPIPYIKQKGYGEKETQILNNNTKNWSMGDWELHYCNKGIKDYLIYRDFRKQYKFTTEQCQMLLSGQSDNQSFKDGFFKVKNYKKATTRANMVVSVGKYFIHYKERMFMRAMVTCFDNKDYDHSKFLKKLSYQGNSLQKNVDKKSYLRRIEEIYNFKSREATKKLRLF
tara:strand:+ start:137 stop:847 length:711 start_codon:yes stop_codon:yes gene_type:complete